MSGNIEYRNIIGKSYVAIDFGILQQSWISAAIDREVGFLESSELITFNKLVSISEGEEAAIYHHATCEYHGRTWNFSSAFYDWLKPPENPYYFSFHDVTINSQYVIAIGYTEFNPMRITNSGIDDNFALLIVITPGDEGFFESTN